MELYRRTFAEISIDNLVNNWHQIKNVVNDDRFICPMVKANAYGHGDVQVSLALERAGAQVLGVCLIEEGLFLRSSGIQAQILVFRGFDKQGAQKILEYQMTPVVSSWEQIKALESVADDPVKVHLKFDTGMKRLGFDIDQIEDLFTYFKKSKKLKLKAVLTHLAFAEDALNPDGFTAKQLSLFAQVVNHFKPLNVFSHVLNTAAIAALAKVTSEKLTHTTGPHILLQQPWGLRPGLALYGYQSNLAFKALDLKPVMTLKSVVNNIRDVNENETVSYGGTWTAARDSRIAVVPLGYADGMHRLISNKGKALFANQLVPIIGRICMDFLMLDVTDVIGMDDASKWIDEEVIFFGYNEKGILLSADDVATWAQTISWETLTSVGERVPRHFKGFKNL